MSLKIEAGKYYRTRDGRKVGPMVCRRDALSEDIGRWCVKLGDGECWSDSGKANSGYDLIAEWRDQPAHIITHNGRVYDLTALETPFGLLPKPVKEALQAWPYGVERYIDGEWIGFGASVWWKSTTYRAKPAPAETRVTCLRYTPCVDVTWQKGTCIKRDGEILWDTWEPEA